MSIAALRANTLNYQPPAPQAVPVNHSESAQRNSSHVLIN